MTICRIKKSYFPVNVEAYMVINSSKTAGLYVRMEDTHFGGYVIDFTVSPVLETPMGVKYIPYGKNSSLRYHGWFDTIYEWKILNCLGEMLEKNVPHDLAIGEGFVGYDEIMHKYRSSDEANASESMFICTTYDAEGRVLSEDNTFDVYVLGVDE